LRDDVLVRRSERHVLLGGPLAFATISYGSTNATYQLVRCLPDSGYPSPDPGFRLIPDLFPNIPLTVLLVRVTSGWGATSSWRNNGVQSARDGLHTSLDRLVTAGRMG
jgi:hypothetical protein